MTRPDDERKLNEPQQNQEIDYLALERDFWKGHSSEDDCEWEISSESEEKIPLAYSLQSSIESVEYKFKLPGVASSAFNLAWKTTNNLESTRRREIKDQKRNLKVIQQYLKTGQGINFPLQDGDTFRTNEQPEGTIVRFIKVLNFFDRTIPYQYYGIVEGGTDSKSIMAFDSMLLDSIEGWDTAIRLSGNVNVGEVSHIRIKSNDSDDGIQSFTKITDFEILKFGHGKKEENRVDRTVKQLKTNPSLG